MLSLFLKWLTQKFSKDPMDKKINKLIHEEKEEMKNLKSLKKMDKKQDKKLEKCDSKMMKKKK